MDNLNWNRWTVWVGLCSESTVRNASLVEGKTVTLVKDISETDRFDRLLRYVLVGDVFVVNIAF